jgi:hypothetical protein
MLISKIQTQLSDKMLPPKVKIIKQNMGLSKIRKDSSTFPLFGSFFPKTILPFFKISIKFSICNTFI